MGQSKNLSSRQDLNLWPPRHRASTLSTWATENLWRARPYTRFIFHISFTTHCNMEVADPSSMQDVCQIWTYYNCCRICFLNTDGVGRSLIFLGSRFHNFDPLYLIECFPCVIVLLNLGITNSLFLSGYLVSVLWKRSAMYLGQILFLTLHIRRAISRDRRLSRLHRLAIFNNEFFITWWSVKVNISECPFLYLFQFSTVTSMTEVPDKMRIS